MFLFYRNSKASTSSIYISLLSIITRHCRTNPPSARMVSTTVRSSIFLISFFLFLTYKICVKICVCLCVCVCALGWVCLPAATSLSAMNLPTSWRLIKTYARSCGLKQTWAVGHSFACHSNQLTALEAWIFKPFCRNVLLILLPWHCITWVFLRFGLLGALSCSHRPFFYFFLLGPSSLQICNFKFHLPSLLKTLLFFLWNSRALHRPVSSIPSWDVAGQLAIGIWGMEF